MKTYVVLITQLGRVKRLEVWAASASEARRWTQATYPDATVTSVEVRRAF